jgi:hypothetical protein
MHFAVEFFSNRNSAFPEPPVIAVFAQFALALSRSSMLSLLKNAVTSLFFDAEVPLMHAAARVAYDSDASHKDLDCASDLAFAES